MPVDVELKVKATAAANAPLVTPTIAELGGSGGSGSADFGTAITSQSLEAGGAGNLGWLASIRKAITDRLPAALVGGRLDVNIGASAITQAVSGSVTANAGTNLNTSALATSAKQPALGTAGAASTDVITVQGIASGTAQPISGSLTNISGTVSLPTGASTAAKQPALGTAGTPSADVISVQGVASGTTIPTTATVTSMVPGTAATSLGKAEDAAHTSGDVGVMMLAVRTDSTAARSGTDGDYEPPQITGGALTVQQAALTAANDTVSVGTKTTGGASTFRSIDLDETEEEVKATAGTLYGIKAGNRTAAPLYLKLYNATAASTVVGTTTPFDTILVPANADSDGAGFIWESTLGRAFGTALSVAVTTGIADNDTGAPGVNDCLVSIGYA